MPAVWPSTLPRLQLLGLSLAEDANVVIRTRMLTGPAKMRNRASVGVRTLNEPVKLTGAQYAALLAFYNTTLARVEPFTRDEPSRDAQAVLRFVLPPSLRLSLGGSVDDRRWEGELALEVVG